MSKISRNHRDPNEDRDFRQFTRAFDRPIAPSRSFADTLRQQLVQPSVPTPANHQPGRHPVTADSPPAVTLVDRRPWRVGLSILEIAAALLLISALALSAYVINAVGRPSASVDTLDRQSARLGSAATPQALDLSAGVNWGGDQGRSHYYGDDSVDTATGPIDLRIGDANTSTVGPGLVVGDSWYGWTVRAGVDAFLRVNLETGNTVWERPYRTWGTLASDGQRIFAFQIDVSDTPTPIPVALDMTTGEITWRGAALHPFATQVEFENEANAVFNLGGPPTELETYYMDLTSEDHSPVVIGDKVYFTDGMATTVALNTSDGSERWRYDRSANFAGYSDKIGTPAVGTIVANERYLFVMLPDWSIVSLDPKTGRELGRSFRGGFVVSTRHVVGMNVVGDRLIVFTASSFVDTNSSIVVPDGPGGLFGAVSVLDARTLDVLVTSDFIEGGIIHEAVVTSTSAFVLSYSERGERELVEVDLVTGALSEPFGTGLLGRSVRLSGSGDTLVAAVPSGSVHVFSMETHELLGQHGLGLTESPTLVDGPVPVVDGRPVVIWKAGPNDPVPQMPEATPLP